MNNANHQLILHGMYILCIEKLEREERTMLDLKKDIKMSFKNINSLNFNPWDFIITNVISTLTKIF